MSNEKYTGQNAGTQALQDFFADMATGFAVQEQVADTTIVELDEGAELKGVLIQYDVAGSGAGYDLKKWVANFNRLTKYERANTLVALERIKDKDVKVFFDAAKSASDWDDIEAIMTSAKKHADKNSKPMFEGLDESVEEIDVSDFKARAKKLGYKVKTKSYSDFSAATVINVKTGNEVGSVSSSGASITKGLMDDDNTEYYKMANKVKVTDGMRRVTIPRHSGITESSELTEAQQKELDEAKKKTSMKMEMDTNGNRVLRISSPEGSFTIQTNTNLPEIHRRSIELDTKEAFEYVDAYLKKNGSTGKRQAVWNAYGSYSGFDNTTNESAEITDHSKRSKEELDQHAQMRRERDKRLAAMGVKTKRLVKEGEESTDTDLDEAAKSKTGTYFVQALKGLMADGLEEKDHRDAATELLKYTAQSGIIKMDDVAKVAKKFGVGMGSGMFKEDRDVYYIQIGTKKYKYPTLEAAQKAANDYYEKKKVFVGIMKEDIDTTAPEWTEFAEAIDLNDDTKLQELFTFFKKEVKPVAAVDMGGDDVTEKWTPNIESMVFGKYSFMLWKNKTKSEWYGLAYNTRNGETKKTLESSTSKSAIIKQLKAMVTGHEPVTEEVEGVDVDPKTVVEGIIEKYQTARTKSADLVIEGLEQLIEYIAEENPPLEAEGNHWSPEQETLVRGKNTLVMWKNKTKSEWYGYSYNTRTGELLVSITRKTKPEVVLDLRKFAVDLPVTE